jgi:hypothetical protein
MHVVRAPKTLAVPHVISAYVFGQCPSLQMMYVWADISLFSAINFNQEVGFLLNFAVPPIVLQQTRPEGKCKILAGHAVQDLNESAIASHSSVVRRIESHVAQELTEAVQVNKMMGMGVHSQDIG